MRTSLKGIVLAAGPAALSLASPASAGFLVHLNSAAIDQTCQATINTGSVNVTAYANGINFNVTNVDAPNATYDLFALLH